MKKIFSIAMSVLLAFSVVACSNSETKNPPQGTTPPLPTDTPAPITTSGMDSFVTEETPKPAIDYPLESHQMSYNSEQGYSANVEMKIGKWIKSTNNELFQQAWESVGGTGEMPLPLAFDVVSDVSAIAIGLVTIENTTSDFSFTNRAIGLYGSGYDGNGCSSRYTSGCDLRIIAQYSTDYPKNNILTIDGTIFPKDILPQDTWGAVPFVLVKLYAFDPANPDGKQDFLDEEYQIEVSDFAYSDIILSEKFKIGVSW